MPKDYDILKQKLADIEVKLLQDFSERNLSTLQDIQDQIQDQLTEWQADSTASPDKRLAHKIELQRLLNEAHALEQCLESLDWEKPGEWRRFLDEHGNLVFFDEQGEPLPEWTVRKIQDKKEVFVTYLPDSEPGQRNTEMNTIHWPKVQEIAREIWKDNPSMPISTVAEDERILNYLEEKCGNTFSESYRRKKLQEVAPLTLAGPGRPKKTALK